MVWAFTRDARWCNVVTIHEGRTQSSEESNQLVSFHSDFINLLSITALLDYVFDSLQSHADIRTCGQHVRMYIHALSNWATHIKRPLRRKFESILIVLQSRKKWSLFHAASGETLPPLWQLSVILIQNINRSVILQNTPTLHPQPHKSSTCMHMISEKLHYLSTTYFLDTFEYMRQVP